MGLERRVERLDARAAEGVGRHHRDVPADLRGQREHPVDLAHERVGVGMVGLVDDDDVRDLHHAGLQGLDGVAGAGDQHEHHGVGVVGDVDLGLSNPDGFDVDLIAPRGVHEQRRLQGRRRDAAQRATRGHRADEHAGVEEMLLQADAVAEHGTAGERRGGIDREHRDLALARAPEPGQRADQRRLAGPGRPGKADHRGVAGVRVDRPHELAGRRVVVLDQRDGARQRPAVAGQQALG